jgi:NADH:ubiquinone oxidoreductase subunit F (NADH-binding)
MRSIGRQRIHHGMKAANVHDGVKFSVVAGEVTKVGLKELSLATTLKGLLRTEESVVPVRTPKLVHWLMFALPGQRDSI